MFGFQIITITPKGEMALRKALAEDKQQTAIKRLTFNKVVRQEVINENPLCVNFEIVSKALLKAYNKLPIDYLTMIFNKYAGDVMKGNNATEKDYIVKVLR